MANGRRSSGRATLRTGVPPGVIPFSWPWCAWPWMTRSAPGAIDRFRQQVAAEEREDLQALADHRPLGRRVVHERDAVVAAQRPQRLLEPRRELLRPADE